MKFIKFFRFDFRYGILKICWRYLALALLTALGFFESQAALRSLGYSNASLGDYMLCISGGIKEYIPLPGEVFRVPYLWLIHHLLLLYLTLNYMPRDLKGFGQQTIFRAGSRSAWWLSKCAWQILSVCLGYALEWAMLLVLSVCTGVRVSLAVSPFIMDFIDFGPNLLPSPNLNMWIFLTVLPLLFPISLGLLQMSLCLWLKPALSYLIPVSLCIASSYTIHPLLPGNYAMALRSSRVISNGVHAGTGLILLICLSLLSVIAGLVRFQKTNILGRE